jgi:hypothetical protein
MRNLIPENRTDKNGITSTRWVKPAAALNPTGIAIPMPIASIQEPIDLTYEVLVIRGLLQAKNDTVHTDRMIGDNLRYIAERDTGLLNQIKVVASENEPASFMIRNLIKKDGFYAVNSPMSVRDPSFDPERGMRELETALHMIPLCTRLEKRLGCEEFECGSDGYILVQSITRKLRQEGVTGLSAEQTLALTMITYARNGVDFYGTDEDIPYSDIERDIDYIVDHLDEVEGLLPELHARKVCDRATIESLLTAPARAVRDGIL